MQPRLLPDFAAVPTAAERRAAARWHVQAALPLDLDTEPAAPACACCSSHEHGTDACPHGTAPALDLDPADALAEARELAGPDAAAWRIAEALEDVNSPERVAARRAMFAGFGWTS
jgi:hypothetical protein